MTELRNYFWGRQATELRGQLRSQMEFGNEGKRRGRIE